MKGHNGHHQLAIGTPLASQVPIQVDESDGGGLHHGLENRGCLDTAFILMGKGRRYARHFLTQDISQPSPSPQKL